MTYNYVEENLRDQAYLLAGEIHAGQWDRTPGAERPTTSPGILRELRRR
ncbi:MAG TPA: hypothetical protein VG387_19285 [Rhizomicrobium sp.]|jgi:hypothetical protein|nr:hypothetical protein [Rhizomicrobium sp.]